MRKFNLFLFLVLFSFPVVSRAQQRVSGAVPGYGEIFPIPDASEIPDPSLDYKVVVDVSSGRTTPEGLNWALNNLARMLNLHESGGISAENMHVVAVIHGGVTTSVLTDEAYRKRFGKGNPNSGLIAALAGAGVRFVICGQSLHARNVDREDVMPGIALSVSALTALTTYQMRDFALLRFN